MKGLIELFANDLKGFTRREKVIYGVVVPVMLFAVVLFAAWIETL